MFYEIFWTVIDFVICLIKFEMHWAYRELSFNAKNVRSCGDRLK